eukprot:4136320-Ditylum_brightwellii.AAC.1
MSRDHAEGIEQFADILERRHNFSKLEEGATYVPAEIAVSMKEEARNCELIGIVDHGITTNSYPKKYKQDWPLFIYPYQK